MSGLVWGVEWRIATSRRRLFVLNVFVPLVLVTPIAMGAAPPVHAAAVYAVLFAIFGTFGSAIPLVRDAEAGLTGRVLRAGVPSARYLLERTAAGAVLDVLQLAPALAVVSIGFGATPRGFLLTLVVLAGTAWVACLVGVLVAVATRSLAEAALFSSVTTLLLLHLSGVFRTPLPGSIGAFFEAVSPFRALHETLLAMSMATPIEGVASLALWAVCLGLGIGALAGRATRSLGVASRG